MPTICLSPRRPGNAPSSATGPGGVRATRAHHPMRAMMRCTDSEAVWSDEAGPGKSAVSPGLMAHFALERQSAFAAAAGPGGRNTERLAECCELLDSMAVKCVMSESS